MSSWTSSASPEAVSTQAVPPLSWKSWLLWTAVILAGGIWGLVLAQLDLIMRIAFAAVPVYLALCLHRPWICFWSLPAFFAATPYHPIIVSLFNYALPVLGLGILGVHLALGSTTRVSLPRTLGIWFLAYFAWTTWTAFFGVAPVRSLGDSVRILLLALVLAALWGSWDKKRIPWLLGLFVVQLIPPAIAALVQFQQTGVQDTLFFFGDQPKRQQGLYSESPNALGLMLSHGVLILSAWLFRPVHGRITLRRGLEYCLAGAMALLFLAALITTFSRGAYLYTCSGLFLFAMLRTWSRITALVLLAGVGILFVVPLPLWLEAVLRLESGASLRPDLYKAAWRMLMQDPWTGIGAGTMVFEHLRSAYLDTDVVRELTYVSGGGAHNILLNKGAQLGWPGIALVAALFGIFLSKAGSGVRLFLRGDWIAGCATAIVVGLVVNSFFEIGATLGHSKLSGSLLFFFSGMYLIREQRNTRAST